MRRKEVGIMLVFKPINEMCVGTAPQYEKLPQGTIVQIKRSRVCVVILDVNYPQYDRYGHEIDYVGAPIIDGKADDTMLALFEREDIEKVVGFYE